MLLETVILQTQGFHPSDFTRDYLQSKLDHLHEAAPSDSVLRASIVRRDHVFKGVIRITSSAGSFLAVSSGRRLRNVAKHLTDQIKRQLDKWKTARFQRRDWPVQDLKFSPEIDINK